MILLYFLSFLKKTKKNENNEIYLQKRCLQKADFVVKYLGEESVIS